MLILWRYIIREHIGPFFFGLSVIILVFLLNLVFRELGRILSRGLEFRVILEFFYLNMAWILALAVPMAVLMSTLMAFGRLSADSEIVAIKASGINMYRLIAPVAIVATLLGLLLVWFNNAVLPEFNHQARLLASDIARKRPTLNLEPGVQYQEIRNYNLMVHEIREEQDTSYVKDVFVEDNSDPKLNKLIVADHGKIYFNHSTGMLVLVLYDGEMHQLDLETMEHYRRISFPKHILSISIPDMILRRSESEYRGDREKSAQTMMKEVHMNRQSIETRHQRIRDLVEVQAQKYLPPPTVTLTEDLSSGELKPPQKTSAVVSGLAKFHTKSKPKTNYEVALRDHQRLSQQLKSEMNVISQLKQSNYILLVEIHKKYSIPAACLVFVLIGAPLGIMARKGGLAIGGSISLGFFLLYWVFLIAGEELADNQHITPFMAMWLANIVVGAAGVYLVIQSVRESTFIQWERLNLLLIRLGRRLLHMRFWSNTKTASY
jgi:lipopolysaccharide export system permease protein